MNHLASEETRLPVTEQIRPQELLADLPEGVGFATPKEPGGSCGIDRLGEEVVSIAGAADDRVTRYMRSLPVTGEPRGVIGPLMIGVAEHRREAKILIGKIMEQHPDLCWFRGGGLEEQDGVLLLQNQIYAFYKITPTRVWINNPDAEKDERAPVSLSNDQS